MALAPVGERHIFFDVVGNRAHADLIAQVTDGDIRHTVGAQLFPQHIAAGLQGGHVQPDGIVTDPQGVRAAGFDRDDCRWLAGSQLGSLSRGVSQVFGKGRDPHA